jgi:hypothetical protein
VKISDKPLRGDLGKSPSANASAWERIIEIGESIPARDRARSPADAAERFDEYLQSRNTRPA